MSDPGATVPPPPAHPSSAALSLASASVHTADSLGRTIIAEALRLQAQQESTAPIPVSFTVKSLPGPPSTESKIKVPPSGTVQVCVVVGSHHACIWFHSPITVGH